MSYTGKKQGVISGSITWNGKEYVEIFDQKYKYLYGEVDDLFLLVRISGETTSTSDRSLVSRTAEAKRFSNLIAYGSWVEYDVVDSPNFHPNNCFKRAINIDMDVKRSIAPTNDEFGKKLMNVRDFNKVDYFQFDSQDDGILTHKSTIRRNFSNDAYYNDYYGEVNLTKDSKNRLIQHDINELDVMMTFIPSTKYPGVGPHWEVTHFINKGKMYSINGYLSIRGFVLRGPGGVVRNRRDVYIPPDSLRPKGANSLSISLSCNDPLKTPESDEIPDLGTLPFNTGFGTSRCMSVDAVDKKSVGSDVKPPREIPNVQHNDASSTLQFGMRAKTNKESLAEASQKAPRAQPSYDAGFGVSVKEIENPKKSKQETPNSDINASTPGSMPKSLYGFKYQPPRDNSKLVLASPSPKKGFGKRAKESQAFEYKPRQDTPKIGANSVSSDSGFCINDDSRDFPATIEKPMESPKPRGLAYKGSTTFGASSRGSSSSIFTSPVKNMSNGFGTSCGFAHTKSTDKNFDELKSVSPHRFGFGTSYGAIGFKPRIPRQSGYSFESSYSPAARPHPLDDSFDFPSPVLADQNNSTKRTSESIPHAANPNSFYDDWGDSLPEQPRFSTGKYSGSWLPPHARTGLGRYSHAQF